MAYQVEFITTATTTVLVFFICCINFWWFRRDNHCLPPVFTVVDNGDAHYCAVCLYDVKLGEKCRKLQKCGHAFHVNCVDIWLQSHWTCPLCRRKVSDRRQSKSGVFSYLISRSEDFLSKICNPLDEELVRMLFENAFASP
ncbi:hypothetical protein R3W88_026710 [Solanum pinnatisectum]|uniref:RING-type domain-containing protein n=1 Tax=Solanum pinnatisectum TaxID=50273 RepID=A0AAV9LE92_9SOLN|nr:hypothetical protein R3W88_026710 [Solanum pinnatisectum]